MNTYILYKLTFPNNKVYIGQTNNFDKRMNQYIWFAMSEKARKYSQYNYLISKKIRKYDWNNIKKEILFTAPQEFIDELETKLICDYNSADYDFGYNVLEFAKSPRGYKHSDESKEKQRKSMEGKEGYWKGKKRPEFSGENHPMFGKEGYWKNKKRPEISEKLIGKNNPNFSKKQSKKSIEKRTNTRIENKSGCKSVDAYTKYGEYIKTFESIQQAAIDLNVCRSHISAVCKNKLKSNGGYKFKYHIENTQCQKA